jgi:predicted dehydrogenase
MHFSRRDFLATGAVAAGALVAGKSVMLPEPAYAAEGRSAASDRVRFGIIGVGMQGSGLLKSAIELPGVECVAACDLYDGRHTLAKEIVRPDLPTTRRYQELLDNKEIDCVIAAVPDHWHRKVVVDTVSAGKDIYCEKPMSHSINDGIEMIAAEKKSGRIIQIGSQRVSSALLAKARELYAKGTIGDLMMVEGSLGRNDPTGAWEYPPPPDLSTQTLDWDTWQGDVPKRPFDANIFARWRCWKEYGTGVAGDLLVHLVSGMMFVMGINEAPSRAMAMGGILRWPDGRNMPDVHATLFEYGKIPVYMRLNLGTENPEIYRFAGSKGILEVTERTVAHYPQSGKDESPSYYTQGYPKAMLTEYLKKWHEEHDAPPGREPMLEGVTYAGTSFDELKPHLWTFFEAVRTRKGVVEDAVFGHNAAAACHIANESYFRKSAVTYEPMARVIKG